MSVRRNSIVNLTGSIIPMLVMLITVPLYLKTLGEVRYGVLSLVWLILGYFSFLEMGLGKATANHIARMNDASDGERGTIFWTALSVNAAFGTIAAVILWVIGSLLMTKVLKIPAEYQAEALAALPWMIATLPLALISSVLNGTLEGRNRFLTVNILQIASTVVFQLAPLVVAYICNPSLSVVIPAAVLSRAVMNIPFLVACYKSVPLTLRPNVSKNAVSSLLSYGSWVAVTGMIGPLLETVDRFLIGAILGAQAVTHYTLPYQLVTKARVIPASLSRALFPKFSSGSTTDAGRLAIDSLRSLVMVMTPTIILGIVLLKPFMLVWVGTNMAEIASPLGEVFLLGVWINSLAYIPYTLLQGTGRPDIVAKFHALEIVPFLLLLWAVMHFWGLYGAAWAWTFRVSADFIFLFRYSGMPSKSMNIMITPAVMIISAIVSLHNVANQDLRWRAALGLFFIIWAGVWFLKWYGNSSLSELFHKQRPDSPS